MQGNVPVGGESGQGSAGALSVSDAMALAQNALESVTVRIIGEVSQVSIKAGYKAAYFTVKDQRASLPCMMWNNRYRASGINLAVGQLVELVGRFTLYAPKGRMNFDVFSIALAGEGNLRLQVANLAKKLQAEGLTSAARKRPVPLFPERIGLVTSPRSAAVHDVLRTLRRRFPVAQVLIAGVPVEGKTAAAGIAEGIDCVVEGGAEVVLVVRGGGSFEDLMPFNDEALARKIASCPVPVITGIGHEVDTTIADMVSDVRASTPTGAAEAVSPARESLDEQIAASGNALASSVVRLIERQRAQCALLGDRGVFRDPMLMLTGYAQAIDDANERIDRALPTVVQRDRTEVQHLAERIERSVPLALERSRTEEERAHLRMNALLDGALRDERSALSTVKQRITLQLDDFPRAYGQQVNALAARLDNLSPLKTLARGYAIALTEDGGVVRSVEQAPAGAHVDVRVADGTLACIVEDARRVNEG